MLKRAQKERDLAKQQTKGLWIAAAFGTALAVGALAIKFWGRS